MDLSLGIGIYHAIIHGEGELPDNVEKMTVFSTFGSISAELGFRISDSSKLAIKPYYHSRNYSYESDWDDGFQLYGHYLDVPLSLSINLRRTELFAGPGVGVLLEPFVFVDSGFTEPEGGWDDLERIIPSLHIGTRLPLNRGKTMALEVMYAHDLIPFSALWGRKVSQDRFTAHLTARFLKAPPGKDLLPDSLKLGANYPTLGVGFGFQVQAVAKDGEFNYDYDTEYRRARFIPAFEVATPLSGKFSLALHPTYNVRSYTLDHYPSDDYYSFRAGYWDFPLMLVANVDGVEYGIGPNLAVRASQRYKLGYDDPVPDALKDAAALLPGYAVNMRLGFKKHSPWAVYMHFSQDLVPFSQSNSVSKAQSRTAFYLSYRFAGNRQIKDLLPDGFRDKYRLQKSTSLGLTFSRMAGIDLTMPYLNVRKEHRFASGFGWGSNMFWGATAGDDKDSNLGAMFVRSAYQLDISWRLRFLEAFIAPGFGADVGFLVDSTPDAWFPIFPYMNLSFLREAGLRLHLSPRVSLNASIGAVNSVFFKEYPVYKFGVSLRK